MNQEQFFQGLEKGYAECVAISRRKNADYAGADDPFRNFRGGAAFGIPVETGILVRMLDKFARVSNLIKPGAEAKVKDERITDTLEDLCNYSMILKLYLEQKNAQ